MEVNEITGSVVHAAMKVHTALGPGLLERAYQRCLAHELTKHGFRVRREVPMTVEYDGVPIGLGYRLDLLVENIVVVEVKAVARILPVHEAQLVSQLRLSNRPVGLLINFHVHRLRDGIVRKVNRL